MVFSSIVFLFVFLPVVLALYYVVPAIRWKNVILLAASIIFYAWGEPVYIVLMLLSILFNFVMGLELERLREDSRRKKLNLIFTVIVNLCILGFFKYYGFLLGSINSAFHLHIPYRELALPVGISFYTFQTLSYILDLYRGDIKVQKNLLDFALYITMFPQLIAGPIVRYVDIQEQLESRVISWHKAGVGAEYFIKGLAKKVLLANTAGAVYTSIQGLGGEYQTVVTSWIGILFYTMQIYFDFSGYSDMAIGLGKMMGFQFCKNFDYPYTSRSVTEFWRRWHISLGTWFREYVYIPLGGNRKGKKKQFLFLMIVWALTGIWHGAAWNFLAWGLYFGILLAVEKFFLKPVLERLPAWAGWLYTFVLVMVSWVIFALDSLKQAGDYLLAMVGRNGLWDEKSLYLLASYGLLLVVFTVGATLLPSKAAEYLREKTGEKFVVFELLFVVLVFGFSVVYLTGDTYNPFLYFRF